MDLAWSTAEEVKILFIQFNFKLGVEWKELPNTADLITEQIDWGERADDPSFQTGPNILNLKKNVQKGRHLQMLNHEVESQQKQMFSSYWPDRLMKGWNETEIKWQRGWHGDKVNKQTVRDRKTDKRNERRIDSPWWLLDERQDGWMETDGNTDRQLGIVSERQIDSDTLTLLKRWRQKQAL